MGDEPLDPRPLRVLLVDDHAVVRCGLRALFETEPGLEVVGEAATGREAVTRAAELCPDVILMDLVMPEMDGASAIAHILAHDPTARVLVLTSFAGCDPLLPALRAGAVGCLLKDADPRELVRAVRDAGENRSCLDPGVARRLLRELSAQPATSRQGEPLSAREEDVLRLLARGLTNRQIAERLGVSEATVRTHVGAILRKLDLANRTQAALHALRIGLVTLDQGGGD